MSEVTLSEDLVGKKLDRCISDTIVKGCEYFVLHNELKTKTCLSMPTSVFANRILCFSNYVYLVSSIRFKASGSPWFCKISWEVL